MLMFGKVFVLMGKNIFFSDSFMGRKKYLFLGSIVQTHRRTVIFKFIVKYIWKWLLNGQLFSRTHLKILPVTSVVAVYLTSSRKHWLDSLVGFIHYELGTSKYVQTLHYITKNNRQSNKIFFVVLGEFQTNWK